MDMQQPQRVQLDLLSIDVHINYFFGRVEGIKNKDEN
jgi:hypothetical protein